MNIKLTINGKEIDAQISEADAQKIQPSESRFSRSKGVYYFANDCGHADSHADVGDEIDEGLFSTGNYYTSKNQAQDHIRALKLWQAIKVFRQEREGDAWKKFRWDDPIQDKFFLAFSQEYGAVQVSSTAGWKKEGTFFADKCAATAAASEFYGELMWYFTEYDDD